MLVLSIQIYALSGNKIYEQYEYVGYSRYIGDSVATKKTKSKKPSGEPASKTDAVLRKNIKKRTK